MTTPLASVSSAPSVGDHHPSALAFSCINNAAQIAAGLEMPGDDGGSIAEDGARIVELLAQASGHVGALNALLKRQERVIEEQRVECLREKQYSTKVEEKNSALSQRIIALDLLTTSGDQA